jgi:hypothetical protein
MLIVWISCEYGSTEPYFTIHSLYVETNYGQAKRWK